MNPGATIAGFVPRAAGLALARVLAVGVAVGTGRVCAGQTAPGPAVGAARPSSGRIAHVRVTGDLEAMAAARRVGRALERAASDGDALVVLELDGNGGRADVALAMIDAVRGAAAPVAVYLADARDRRVGAAALSVALASGRAVIEAGTAVRSEPAPEARGLAPEGTDWERVERELSGAVYAGLRDMGGPVELAGVVAGALGEAGPGEAWAVVGDGGAVRVVFEDPGAGAGVKRLVKRSGGGAGELSIDAPGLKDLHAVRGTAASAGLVARVMGARGVMRGTETIEGGVARARRDVEIEIAGVDALLSGAGKDLDLPRRPRPDVSEDVYRRGVARAREKLSGATARLDRAEKLVEDYPELARTPAPGQTEVGGKATVYASRWRSTFQKRRDQIKALDEQASALETPERP